MADIYLSSVDGSDGDDGSTWALAKATLAAAMTAAGAGGTVYVDSAHAETQASAMTLTSPGTTASPVAVLCVDRTGDAEPPTALAATASVATTGANSISFAGFAYCYGVTFSAGDAGSAAHLQWLSTSAWWWKLESCVLKLNNTSTSSRVKVGGVSGATDDHCALELVNTPFHLGSASQYVANHCKLVWTDTPTGFTGSVPTYFADNDAVTSGAPQFFVRGVGLDCVSGLFRSTIPNSLYAELENCDIGTMTMSEFESVATNRGTRVGRSFNCGASASVIGIAYSKGGYTGRVYHQSGGVARYRVGGASDGVTTVSREMVSTPGSKFYDPLTSDWSVFWNEVVDTPVTVSFAVANSGVTLTDADAWIEVEYLGSATVSTTSLASDRAASVLATPADQPADATSVWVNCDGYTFQRLSVTVTPLKRGPIRARVCVARASTTVYFCPKPDVS